MFKNFVIGLVLLAMIGIPVSFAIQSARQGYTSVDTQITESFALLQENLPIAVDDHQSLVAATFKPPFLDYTYTVDVSPAKLMEMKDYFTREGQADICENVSLLTFQREDYGVRKSYKTPESETIAYTTLANPHKCNIERQGANNFYRIRNPTETAFLEIEYANFFVPFDLENGLVMTELFRRGAKLRVDIPGGDLVDMPEDIGHRVMAELCSPDGELTALQNIEVMPSNNDDVVFTYILNTEICRSGVPEFRYGGRGRGFYMSDR